jgi:hypothetical protein
VEKPYARVFDSTESLEPTYSYAQNFADVTLRRALRDIEKGLCVEKPGGILVFNNFVIHDLFQKLDCGIVPVVNHMIVNHGWRSIGFALEKHMFCDIAVAR